MPSEYSVDPKTGHPNSKHVWIPDNLVSSFQMVWAMTQNWYSNVFVVRLFKNLTICQLGLFWPFEYQTCPVFRSLL